ncbi:unnamed protein product [Heterobilharzia americana]|nr:unnamed protein product [Heterobilharzia americana]
MDSVSEDYVNFQPGGVHKKITDKNDHTLDVQQEEKTGKWTSVRKFVIGARHQLNTTQMLRLSSIFSILAQNQFNVITAGDILHIMRALGDALTEAELHDLIFEVDIDRDGKLDFSELCIFVIERIYKKKLNRDLEELFQILDQDGDGKLSKDDIRNILRYFELDFSEEIVGDILKKINGSDSNYITYTELLNFIVDSEKDFTITDILSNPL